MIDDKKQLHPIVKLLLLASYLIVFFTDNILIVFLSLISFTCICISIKTNPLRNKYLAIFIIVFLMISILFNFSAAKSLLSNLLASMNLCIRFLIIFGSGLIYGKFLPPSEVIYLIRKILPKNSSLVIPVLVAFRGIPIGTQITKNILLAQKARGLTGKLYKISKLKRFFGTFFTAFFAAFIEFLFVFSTTVFLRGINENEGTNYRKHQFKLIDLFVLFYLTMLIFFILLGDGVLTKPY